MESGYQNIPWTEGKWTNDPAATEVADGNLIVTAEGESDYWERTLYHFQHKNGHALLADMERTEAMEVTFRLEDFKELYDQAGMMLWYDEVHWMKIGIEVIDKEPNISIVVTNEYSDCSNFPVPSWEGKNVTFRVSPFEDAVLIRVRAEDSRWMTMRLARFPYETGMQAGPMVCAPIRKDLRVVFTRWIKTKTDTAQHEDPPIF